MNIAKAINNEVSQFYTMTHEHQEKKLAHYYDMEKMYTHDIDFPEQLRFYKGILNTLKEEKK